MDILLPRYKSVGISDNRSFYIDKLVRALNHIILPNVNHCDIVEYVE